MGSENLFVECGSCGKDIARSASACPHCGATSGLKKWQWALILVVVLLLIGLLSDDEKKDITVHQSIQAEEEAGEVDVLRVLPSSLLLAYTTNEIAADNTYKGRLVQITGIIEDIGKDIMDNAYLTVRAGNDQYEFRKIQVFTADMIAISRLSRGEQVTITGRVDGLLVNVIIREAVIH